MCTVCGAGWTQQGVGLTLPALSVVPTVQEFLPEQEQLAAAWHVCPFPIYQFQMDVTLSKAHVFGTPASAI